MIRLEPVAELEARIGEPVKLAETQEGLRRVIPILSGVVRGARLNGEILPGGADWQLIKPDGLNVLEARYAIRTGDGADIYVVNRALRHGPPEVMARVMAGEPVDPASYYFRTAPAFETADARYDWLNRTLFLGEGERTDHAVHIRIYAAL